jgi:hypothetical protein
MMAPFGHWDPCQNSLSIHSCQHTAQCLSTYKEKVWGDRVPLSKTPRRDDMAIRRSINKDLILGGSNTHHHKFYSSIVKPHTTHHSL